jgi:chaperonin GroEL
MDYKKVKSTGKRIEVNGPRLKKVILETLKNISDIVGSTLGPCGRVVIIERYENGVPPVITKDGVTVFQSLGYEDPAAHCIMETARDAAKRTATEAGDGTTTATILAESIVRHLYAYSEANKKISPQLIVRHLEKTFRDHIEPLITSLSRKANPDTVEGKRLLKAVATISANGDVDLADAVLKCFEFCGDEGNVTISENSGPSRYEVERVEGFPIMIGYDDCTMRYSPAFINEGATQRCVLDRPVFILYHGHLSNTQTVQMLLEKVGFFWQQKKYDHPNVVLVATGFSDSVLADLATNFPLPHTINVFPLMVPPSPFSNGQLEFLKDLQAVTGAKILDAISNPPERAELEDLGPGVTRFEVTRFRSSIIGHADPDLLGMRVEELEQHLLAPESELDEKVIRKRKANLASGIANLKVFGASNGELKEKRDRADDAVCAVRGAIKAGCLPGGAWTLLKVLHELPDNDINRVVLAKSLMEPFKRLLSNCGVYDVKVAEDILAGIMTPIAADQAPVVYDFLKWAHVDPYEGGVLDSTPAVLEAIRNSISIASQHGTLGGLVVIPRDSELERQEARSTAQFMRDTVDEPQQTFSE